MAFVKCSGGPDADLSQGKQARWRGLRLGSSARGDAVRYADTGVNAVVVLEASAAKLAATYYELAAEMAPSYYERPWKLTGKLRAKRTEVAAAGAAGAGAAAAA